MNGHRISPVPRLTLVATPDALKSDDYYAMPLRAAATTRSREARNGTVRGVSWAIAQEIRGTGDIFLTTTRPFQAYIAQLQAVMRELAKTCCYSCHAHDASSKKAATKGCQTSFRENALLATFIGYRR